MSVNVANALSQLRTKYRLLGVKPPAALFADLDEITGRLDNIAALRHDPHDLADAVADAMAAGKDPATDKAVLEQLARRQLAESNLSRLLPRMRDDRQLEALIRHAPAILIDLAKIVTAADAVLDRARTRIPGLRLDQDYLGALRPEVMSLWGEAREAAQKAQAALDVCAALLVATEQVQQIPHGMKPLLIADLHRTALVELERPDRPVRADDIIEAGHRLSLADAATFDERRRRVERERQEAAAQAEADRANAMREAIRTGR